MVGRRFDVVRVDAGWWLTDSAQVGLPFSSSAAAIAEGKRQADIHNGPASVHLWNNSVPTQVHHNQKVDDADNGGGLP